MKHSGTVASLVPSQTRFVVQGDVDTLRARLASGASVHHLDEERSVVELGDKPADPATAWSDLRRALDPRTVYPVMLDLDGGEHFPTGRVTARFSHPPDAERVAALVAKHGLGAGQPNRYVPSQVSFDTPAPLVYLPHLVDALVAEPDVELAWPDTWSAYRRNS